MATWLIAGGNGQLGRDLTEVLADQEVVALDLPDLDITDPASIADVLDGTTPDVVVNAAAYTAVDAAETDEGTANRVNGVAPGLLAQACAARAGTRLVQVSTDYVFAGDATQPYPEAATPDPRSAYGRSKLLGEEAVVQALPDRSYIVRTAWLYGRHGANFVKTMLRLAGEPDTLEVVDDQVGQPTWSWDLAAQIRLLVEAEAPAGIYHGTNSGRTSWFGLTREIFRLSGLDPERVQPTTTDKFPRPAPRPAFSVLGHDAWAQVGLAPMRSWDEALEEALAGGGFR